MDETLDEGDYRALAGFRQELRHFMRFSERAARACGLSARQHQALLAIRASPSGDLLIGELAERLLLRANSASELVDRLAAHDLVTRIQDEDDRRQVRISLTDQSIAILASLSVAHRTELRRLRPLLLHLLEAL